MSNVLTIPKKLAQKGDLVIVPRADFEEKDTDEAIEIFEKEKHENKLKLAHDFSSILKKG